MTQVLAARSGKITPEMRRVAERENKTAEEIVEGVARGLVVIPANKNHVNLDVCGIGRGLKTKVNANIGASPDFSDLTVEMAKLDVALRAGADTVMDLSVGGDLDQIRREIIKRSYLPVGTVPVYQAAAEAKEKSGGIAGLKPEHIISVIEKHAADGVDFITVHCGVTMSAVEQLQKKGRVTGIVSRGGALLAGWMVHNRSENPLLEQFDRLLSICLEYDVTLSLGDGLRPGCIADATDRGQVSELVVLGDLVDRARQAGVQVMVEGPGHVPINQIEANVRIQKAICKDAPFYVLGPLVTDVAPGYDHITAAIGGAVAAVAGADFLCYVTPSEHLGLPDLNDVREGIISSRIAAHAADLVKGIPGAWEWDLEMARARKALDWEKQIKLAIDPERAGQYRKLHNPTEKETCTMCGEYCAMKVW